MILVYTEVGEGFIADASKFLTMITTKIALRIAIPTILKKFRF